MLFLRAPSQIRQQLLFSFACGLVGLFVLWILEYSWIGRIGFGEGMNSIASLDAYRHFYAAGSGRWDVGLIVNFTGPMLFLAIALIGFQGARKLARAKLSKADAEEVLQDLSGPKLIALSIVYLLCALTLILLIIGVQAFGPVRSFLALKALLALVMVGALVGGTDLGLVAGLRGARGPYIASTGS